MSAPQSVLAGTTPPELHEIELSQETTRGHVAYALMGLLGVLSIGIFLAAVALVRPFDRETVSLLLTGALSPIIGLVGTVVGFYFGQESAKRRRQ